MSVFSSAYEAVWNGHTIRVTSKSKLLSIVLELFIDGKKQSDKETKLSDLRTLSFGGLIIEKDGSEAVVVVQVASVLGNTWEPKLFINNTGVPIFQV